MKKIINFKNNAFINICFLCFTAIFTTLSCESEFDVPSPNFTKAPPEISSVSEAREDKTVTQGVLENTYIIRGKNLSSLVAIYFNDVKASFNPALLTDGIAFVEVPEDAPVLDQSNKMRVENLFGTTEYDFSLLTISGFTEETVNGKKVVNLMGGDFSETSSVTFVSGSEANGNLLERPASFVVVSPGMVQAEVPAGVEQAFIFLETSRGAVARSDSYGFSYSVYVDSLNEDWIVTEWGGTHILQSTEVTLGTYSVKSIRQGWSGITFLPINTTIDFGDYQSISVTLYGTGASGDSVNLALNDFQTQLNLPLIPGQWVKYVIPLADFYPNGGAPDTIFRMDFQESSNTGLSQYIFYIDDFGFL
ncbi:hypothetical protein [Litoribaculum gwangyangense]|uniref:IPT/TIG domain-containing protein n=1 Tax=Litoribaculum gwangyangense TaxID=1130722 RepID=A0ABP9CKQ4_9FLAO